MRYLTYRRLLNEKDTDIPRLIGIYQIPEIARYISIGDNYFRYIANNENVYFYKVYENNTLIGVIHLEKQDSVLYMSIVVFPEFQSKGLAARSVKDIQNDIFGLVWERIEISVDERNAPSRRLFENAGFVRVSEEDELINFCLPKKTGLKPRLDRKKNSVDPIYRGEYVYAKTNPNHSVCHIIPHSHSCSALLYLQHHRQYPDHKRTYR